MATNPYLRRGVYRAIVLALLLRGATGATAVAMAPSADEAQVRAAMVYNLTRFVDWPAWKFIDESTPLVLCFLANDPVGNDMDSFLHERQARDPQNQDRPVVIHRVASIASTESCHIFYASKLDKAKLVEALPKLTKSAVLTISDNPTVEGTIIALPLVESRVQIVVDLHAAQQSGLTLSSKLLRIATVTR